jgi:hypothetical protein
VLRHERILRHVRWLIYLYLVLLLFEGALRKWVVPQFSDPLLIVRDPVVIAIYILAISGGVFPRNAFITSLWIIALCSLAAGIVVLEPYFPPLVVALVTGFGFRSNFLHLPLIFVLPAVFNIEDVKRIGWWTLVIMIPMALLMTLQFSASPESFINRTAGLGEGMQISAGGGKIRAPGTFSFIAGPILYLAAATAFLIYGALSRSVYKMWLLYAAGFAIVIAVGVSGSRSCVGSTLVVVCSVVVILLLRPDAVNRFGHTLVVIVVAAFIISPLPIFKEGIGILSDRFTSSAEAAETTIVGGMFTRVFSSFTSGLGVLDRLPIAGYGLGIGTNGGSRYLVGHAAFLLAEDEWSRVLLESGPIFGLAFLLWRSALACRLGYLSLVALRSGATLPVLLLSSGFLALLNGPFGQPTNLGFAVILNGLCLAATKVKETSTVPASPGAMEDRLPKPMPRRSAYASRLHGPGASVEQPNGFADR